MFFLHIKNNRGHNNLRLFDILHFLICSSEVERDYY